MSWKHRDAKAEARWVRRFAGGTPYSEMELLPPTKGKDFWCAMADVAPDDWSVGGWIRSPIEDWTAGYLRSKGATVRERP